MNPLTVYEIGGVLITLAATLTTYFRSQSEVKKLNSLFVSTLGVVFTMLVSLRFDVLPRIESNLILAQKLSKVPRIEQYIDGLSTATTIADNSKTTVMGMVMTTRLRELEQNLADVLRGRFVVSPTEMPDIALALINNASLSFTATSYISAEAWWDTPWGKTYEEMNFEKVKKGVAVKRIFIFSSDADMTRFQGQMTKEASHGVTVKIAKLKDLGVDVTSDMVVVDSTLAGELTLTPEKGMKQAEFFTARADVDDIARRISRLEAQAEPFQPAPQAEASAALAPLAPGK